MLGNSSKTTAVGIGGMLVAIGTFLVALLDNNPATLPDVMQLINSLIMGFGLIMAKDFNVTGTK